MGQYHLVFDLIKSYFEYWDSHKLLDEHRGTSTHQPWDCVSEYLTWFHQISHPQVQNQMHIVRAPVHAGIVDIART